MDKPDALRLIDVPLALRDDLWHTQAEHVLLKLQANNNQLSAQRDALLETLKLALSSHGVMLMSDPPQDAWKVNRVEERGCAAIKAVEEGR